MKRLSPFVIAALVTAAPGAMACACRDLPPFYEEIGRSSAVFVGRVENVDRSEITVEGFRQEAVRFRVLDAISKVEEDSVVVFTQAGSDCGFEFQLGEVYFIVAVARDGVARHVSVCSSSGRIAEAQERLAALGRNASMYSQEPLVLALGAVLIVLVAMGWRVLSTRRRS